jgi:hypothetical protein
VWLKQSSFGVQLNATAPTTSIDMDGCLFEGYGTGTTTYANQGVGCFEASPVSWVPAKRVSIRNSRFTKFGDPSGGSLAHAIYCYETWGLHVENCEFDAPAANSAGYCIQHYGGPGPGAWIAQESTIKGCEFGADLGPCHGVYTDTDFPTTIRGCTFQKSTGANTDINVAGDAIVDGCVFNHRGDQNIQTYGAGTLLVSDCQFQGVLGGGCASVYIDSDNAVVEISDSRFTGATNGNGNYVLVNANTCEVRVRGCRIEGNPSRAIYSWTGGKVTVTGCRILTANYAIGSGTVALAELHVRENDISPTDGPSGVFDLSLAPTLLDIANNYGTPGFPTETGGTSTQTPGAVTTVTIPHGIGGASHAMTPSRISVTPANAAAAGKAFSVSADNTNITLTFAAALAASTAYAWAWTAEA